MCYELFSNFAAVLKIERRATVLRSPKQTPAIPTPYRLSLTCSINPSSLFAWSMTDAEIT
jgi:hypothetical protein